MPWRNVFLRLVTVVTLVVAAIGVAPAVACAHMGHNHTAPSAEHITVLDKAVAKDMATSSAVQQGQRANIDEARAEATSLFPGLGAEDHQNCPSGCCHSGSHACCGVWLARPIEVLVPPLVRLTPRLSDGGGPGLSPGALPEPPDSLV